MASAEVFPNEPPGGTRRVATDLWRSQPRAEGFGKIMYERQVGLPDPVEPVEPATAIDVRAALARLSPEHRAVITEMYLNRHTVEETAEILGIPVRAVTSRSYYALHILHAYVAAPADPAEFSEEPLAHSGGWPSIMLFHSSQLSKASRPGVRRTSPSG